VLPGPEGQERRATFLDLFFDLVFVFALFQLSQELLHDLKWSDAFQTLVLLPAVLWVWSQTGWATDWFDPAQRAIQVLVIACMFGSFVVAVAVPDAFGSLGLLFAGAYVAVQAGRSLFLVVVLRGHPRQRLELRVLFWYGVSAVPWLAGAVVHGWPRGALWALAIAVEHAMPRLGWPTPGLGRTRLTEYPIAAEFAAERQRQRFIVALGELILTTGLAITSSGVAADRSAAAVVAFATTVLLWRIYIYRAGEILGAAVAAAEARLRVVAFSVYAHLVMVAGIVTISVGDDLVIVHPFGHTQPAWIAVILGGPALFLAGRAILEYAVFGRISPDRVIGVLVLAAISPATIFLPPVLVAVAAALVLSGVAIADAARARRLRP
jgi:low temperature requirement protein LtrA